VFQRSTGFYYINHTYLQLILIKYGEQVFWNQFVQACNWTGNYTNYAHITGDLKLEDLAEAVAGCSCAGLLTFQEVFHLISHLAG